MMALSLSWLLGAVLIAGSSVAQGPDFGNPCPGGQAPVVCVRDPCDTPCAAFPAARCEANYCGRCSARYFVAGNGDGGELEVLCDAPQPVTSARPAGPATPMHQVETDTSGPRPSLPPGVQQCPNGCRGEKGHNGEPGWHGARGARGLKGGAGMPGKYLIYTDGYVLPSGVQVNISQAKQQAGGKVSTASEFGPEARGDKGEQGPQGPPGQPGSPGMPGSMGRPGDHGPVGGKGDLGELGVKGVVGQMGWQGPPGLRGDRGGQGVDGLQGAGGRPGDSGDRGTRGLTGAPGLPGLPGNDGLLGENGVTGISGSPGIRGPPGTRGDKGLQGEQGVSGDAGTTGQDGSTGLAGQTGSPGLAGLGGIPGPDGKQGVTGDYGPDVKEVSLTLAMACSASNNGKVQYDFVSDKLYFCNGREWRCVDHVDCHFSCRVSEWEPWKSCSQTCGQGVQVRHRSVMAAAGPYGNPCPALTATRSCPNTRCTCRAPPNIANGQLSPAQASYPVGDTAQWTCSNGYAFVGSSTALCQEGGRFSTLPRCQPVRCPDPGTLENGERADGALAMFFGGTVTYSCNNGYSIAGARSLQCMANGAWSAATPTCVPADCGHPGTPQNGASNVEGTTYDFRASFSCHMGYELTGEPSIMCRANGQWSDPLPNCMPVSCSNPGRPEHGSMTASGANFAYRSSVTFSCDDGYALIGSAVRLCQHDGVWSGTQPVCNARSCPRVAAPENGEITTFSVTFSIGSRISFACKQGYILQGDRSIRCQQSAAWSAPVPKCERLRCCHLSEPANGRLIETGRQFGDKAFYTCEDGYRAEGSSERTCQISGSSGLASWSGVAGRCVPIQCADPEAPENGARSPAFALFYAGDSVVYTCNIGTEMQGTDTRRCQADGTWDGPIPRCREIICADPGVPTNGARSGDSLRALTDLEFSCNANYKLNGDATRTCQVDGTYTGVQPTCDPNCVLRPWTAWSSCSVTCGAGTEIRTRSILQFPAGEGEACDAQSDARECTRRACALCYGQFGTNDTGYVTPSEGIYAADVLVVVENTQPMSSAINDLSEFLVTMELELLKTNTGTDPTLPNRYTVVGFGRRSHTGEECGHFIVPQSAGTGVTSFTVDDAVQGLTEATADAPSQIKDGYQAMLFAIQNADLRHMPNIAHNLIFLSGSSRTTGCGAKMVTKDELRQAMVSNGMTPNFIVNHRIIAGNDKPEEVLGVRSLEMGPLTGRVAYLRERSSGFRERAVTDNLGVDYGSAEGTIATDYTELAFEQAGMMWNLNIFQTASPGSSQRGSFAAAFTQTKAREMMQDSRACKRCTCEDDGLGGLFRCERQDQEYCACRATGATSADCQRR